MYGGFHIVKNIVEAPGLLFGAAADVVGVTGLVVAVEVLNEEIKFFVEGGLGLGVPHNVLRWLLAHSVA